MIAGLIGLAVWQYVNGTACAVPSVELLTSQFDAVVLEPSPDARTQRPIVQRWEADLKVAVVGSAGQDIERHIASTLDQLLDLTGLRVAYVSEDHPGVNFVIHVGDKGAAVARLRAANSRNDLVTRLERSTHCFGLMGATDARRFNLAFLFLNAEEGDELARHCVTEELTQALGLPNDTSIVVPSIFEPGRSRIDRLTPGDRLLVRTLYDPRLAPGMHRDEAMPIVRGILSELRAEACGGA